MSITIYTDLEYLYPTMTRESGRPTEKDLRQIVQIAAIKVDEQGQELEAFDMLIKPTYTHILPEFFIELTGITQDQINDTPYTLAEGIDAFLSFVATHPIRTYHKDYEVWTQNTSYINREFPLGEFERVRDLLPKYDINPNDYSSGTLYQAVGLDMNGHVHNALHDVRSMAAAMHVLEKQ